MFNPENVDSKSKRGLAGVLAGAILVGGIVVGGVSFKKNADKKPNEPTTTTSVTQAYDELYEQLRMTEDIDVNDSAAVTKRAEDVYFISEKQFSAGIIENIIYLCGGNQKSIDFSNEFDDLKKAGMSDEVYKAKYINRLFRATAELLDDNISDCLIKQSYLENSGETDVNPKYDSLIYAYMLMPSSQTDSSSYLVSKQDAIESAKIVRKQLNNIRDGKVDQFAPTAEEYYNNVHNLTEKKNKADNAKNITGYSYVFYRDVSTKNTLFSKYLTEEKNTFLDKNIAENYILSLEGEIYLDLGLDKDALINAGIDAGKFGETPPDYARKYKSNDAKVADSESEAKREDANEKVDQGGKPVNNSSGLSEQKNVPTTSAESTKEEIAKPEGESSHNKIVDPGGDIIGEVEVPSDNIHDLGNIGGRTYSDQDLENSKTK